MATLTLEDGRTVDIVRKPNVQEKVLAQTQYRKAFKTSPQDMADVMASVDWIVALPYFVTLHRAGVGERMPDLMDDDRLFYWFQRTVTEPGDIVEESAEGEQSPHPLDAPEGAEPEEIAEPTPSIG
ncbi:hypothetical protein M3D75_11670 [Microbacterium enclense]|uniref:hypothetical protein n=1 Tax=Microbacterium enclense TaxID=993073 RepID=UPI0021A63B9D|nr:hypothetical protein [Microbacterium enclense]MCT2086775.1 hypothetical protein [Microbacterium enclense]